MSDIAVSVESRNNLTDGQKNSILELLAGGATIKACSEQLGLSTYLIRKAREKDETFAEMFRDAYETGTEVLEEHAWDRAVNGTLTEHWDKEGNLRRSTYVKSDRLMELLLKGRNPNKYRDTRQTITHEGGFKDTVELKFNSVEAKEVMQNVRKALGLGDSEPVIDGTASPVEPVHPASSD